MLRGPIPMSLIFVRRRREQTNDLVLVQMVKVDKSIFHTCEVIMTCPAAWGKGD
jgi:hypothetical protein